MAWKPYNPYVSPSALNLFRKCPRCFYLERRLKIDRPEDPNFVLQNVIDALMKKEFDTYRALGQAHPLMRDLPGDLIPFSDPRLDAWRVFDNGGLKGVHGPTGLTTFALVDDIWLSRADGSLRVVDYKSYGPDRPFDLQKGSGPFYQRQLEFYAYALLNNAELDAPISSTAYLVIVKPDRTATSFDGALRFETEVVAHTCDTSWIEAELERVYACLESDVLPQASAACKPCTYVKTRAAVGAGEGSR